VIKLAARSVVFLAALLGFAARARAAAAEGDVVFGRAPGAVELAGAGKAAAIFVDAGDHAGVLRAARGLQADVEHVAGVAPRLDTSGALGGSADAIIVGTLGKSRLVDELVRAGKLDARAVAGRWEAWLTAVVADPAPGVRRTLVIAGSDKRGTIYGVYDLSQRIGVSPWAWWADVPVRRHAALSVRPGVRVEPGPAVKYRGIFLNDEAPSLTGWVNEKFGGYTHGFYEKVFELLLRLRGNYLWPAMWASAFNEDDPENARLADEYGIVMGTSHHEPMLRAQQEWKRHGHGAWNYATNDAELRAFWTEGIRRNRAYESIITLGMRGDGDVPMKEESDVPLLQRIVADQRAILTENLRPDIAQIPMLWALYKEVQAYYEKGMRVPPDVTLLWCDDNWGNIRRLPTPEERARPGGAGVYYHFDYVGGPRSYKWLNTVPITKTWEQMRLAWNYGADRIWIVNVGDLKPMELPIEFFLTMAWAPERWPVERLPEFTRAWADRDLGVEHMPEIGSEIASIVAAYTKLNGRRKPELLAPDTYSLVDYHEAETVVADWKELVRRAERVQALVPGDARLAFFQLVLYPVKASAIVNELEVVVGFDRLYAAQGRAATNAFAERARALFREDEALARAYNDGAGGKWRHMMDQTHIGYTYWQQPPRNALPAVTELQVTAPAAPAVAVEGSAAAWPTDDPFQGPPALPAIDVYRQPTRTIDVFNRGLAPFKFTAETSAPWLRVSPARGEVTTETRLAVTVDWKSAPAGNRRETVTIRAAGERKVTVAVAVPIVNPTAPRRERAAGFVETDGVVSIEAEHADRAVEEGGVRWQKIDDYGRTLSAMTPFPVTAKSRAPSPTSPRLEYRVHLFSTGDLAVHLHVAPTLDFQPGRGLRVAVSFDDDPPEVVDALADRSQEAWERSVKDAVRVLTTRHRVTRPGAHVLKVWMVDPAIVLEKIVIDAGGAKPSYLGPPESFRARN
jgi:hypothetical protein